MTAEILDSHVHLLDPVGLTYPWLDDLTIGQQRCDAARFAADAASVTGFTELEELAAACPGTVIVLDHVGKPRCGAGVASWLTALVCRGQAPERALQAVGPGHGGCSVRKAERPARRLAGCPGRVRADRCLFGSGWPICTMATSHRAWLDLVRSVLDGTRASDADREQVLARTAQLTYQLPGVPLDEGGRP